MDAYIYQAALLCADCAKARIIKVEGMAVKPRGYPSDSNAYPQGPYPQGGGEADTPQHCDDCSLFLENPLTGDGMEYVANNILGHYRDREDGKADVLMAWAKEYNIPWYDPGESTLESLRFEHSMSDDTLDDTTAMMFNICGELHERTFKDRKNALRATVFLDAYEYKPGVNPCDPDGGPVVFALAAVGDDDLLTFAREIADEYDSKKKAEEEEEPTPVIFRADRDGSITAVFPTLPASVGTPYTMTCYARVGQHSGCTFEWYRTTKPARDEAAVAALKAELESIGYRLKVYKAISSRLRYEFNRARAAL